MALTDENGMVMPVQPMANYGMPYGGGNGLFGGGDSWLGILFLIALCNGGFGFGGGFGNWGAMGMMNGMYGMGIDYLYPWLNNSEHISDGFRSQQLTSQLGDLQNSVTTGFGNVQTSLCNGFAGVNATVNNAQNAISQQLYTNQLADLERSYASQTATVGGLTNLSQQLATCCCENKAATADVKYTIATEACNTRAANTANTQAILDKLCQLELDGVKAQVEAKNDRIAELQTQLNMANLAASQTAQNAFIQQGFANEVDQLYNRLSSCPVPSTPVYGRTPIFTCNNSNSGCGCGNGFAN